MNHIISGHTPGGGRGDDNKDTFPPEMTEYQIYKAIEEAYNHPEKLGPVVESWQETFKGSGTYIEHARRFFQGPWGNRIIQFYFDYTTNTIDTA